MRNKKHWYGTWSELLRTVLVLVSVVLQAVVAAHFMGWL